MHYGDFQDGQPGTLNPSFMAFASNFRKGGVAAQYVATNYSELVVSLNRWYYVATVYDGTNLKIYVNGKLRSTTVTTGTIIPPLTTADLFIGKSITDEYFVNGVIDDIKIYNGTLTDAQVFDAYTNDLKKPGSVNTLTFNGINNYVEVPDNPAFTLGVNTTIAAWIKTTDFYSEIVGNFEASSPFTGFLFSVGYFSQGGNTHPNAGKLAFFLSSGASFEAYNYSMGPRVDDGKWHHVAISYNGATVTFYVDGISSAPQAATGLPIGNSSNVLRIARDNNTIPERFFEGQIDELQIWNTALTQSQVRDWMCKKISSSHSAYQNLVGYFRFDEGGSNGTGGFNGIYGSLINAPTWQTSGAPLGDASVHDFVNATKAANINAATGENFSVTSTSGNPDGIVVYYVNEAPNSNTGANNGGNNKYFGVFQSGGATPQYTAVYDYTLNPLVNAGNESSLRFAKRNNNAVTTWAQLSALPNEPANTITVTGESTEYILGSVGAPLPVILLSFAASKCNSGVCLLWSTENEQDFSHFEIEKSVDGTRFTNIASVRALNTQQRNSYTAVDNNPANGANYYRLKQVNMDASFTYSRILKVDLSKPQLVSIHPNPAQNSVLVKGLAGYRHIRLVGMNGKIILQKNIQQPIEEINISQLPVGIYMLQAVNENEITTIKLLKQ